MNVPKNIKLKCMIGSNKSIKIRQIISLTNKGKNEKEIWLKNLNKILKYAKKLINKNIEFKLCINNIIIKQNEPQKLGKILSKIKHDPIPTIQIVKVCGYILVLCELFVNKNVSVLHAFRCQT